MRNLFIDIVAEFINIRMGTVAQRDAHRDGTHVELVLRNHPVGFHYFI